MKRKLSLSAQLMVMMILLVAFIILIVSFVNSTFLGKYYQYNKQKEILEGYQEIYEASSDGTLESSDFDVPFERICSNGNINILIIDSDQRTILRSSIRDYQDYQMQLMNMLMNPYSGVNSVIEETDNYSLILVTDSRMDEEFIVLFGRLSDGQIIYMRTALESIRESAALTNSFIRCIGIVTLLLSIVVIFFLSRTISRPLQDLSNLSKQMAGLDFNARYTPQKGGSREIEELGASMNQLSEALEQTISELKVANNELKIDIAKKEEIDTMRKEFLSNVTHELKTPLALISGYAEGLQECINDDPESRDFYCDVIIDETDKMNKMVRKLLTLNQLEFGNDTVEMERFNMTELIQGLVQSNSLTALNDGITIHFPVSQPQYVWGDEFKVEEVITNYLSNAIHHCEGANEIRISYAIHDGLLRTSVFNTGNPIPPEDLDKVWIKFYKVDKARTREYGGSGIGLSIVKAIMDSFHQKCGAINYEDGVEFWMELELANALTAGPQT